MTDARDESGFGLIELLMAMSILSVGLLALVAGFSSGGQALQHASKVSTATAIADAQMESYRAITYDAIALTTASVAAADAIASYAADPARQNLGQMVEVATCASPIPDSCLARRTVTGPDGKDYIVDTYIFSSAPTVASRPLHVVTIVVRDGVAPFKTRVRAQSTFDESTGS